MNFQSLKKKITTHLALILIISVIARIPVVFLFGDTSLENEWRIIVNNLLEHGKFSFTKFDDFYLPNLFMPPLYIFYLYFFTIFNLDTQNYILLILFSQVLLSSLSVVIFYNINKIFFSKKLSFYSSLFFSIFPLYLYSCSQISSITLQIFLLILFLYLFFSLTKKVNLWTIFFISFVAGCLILLRGEFIIILVLSLLYLLFFFKVKLRKILFVLLITALTVSPYLIRNKIIFNELTITKSLGYNLWKGNNPNSKVSGSEILEENLENKINNVDKDIYYRIKVDKIFLDNAIYNIINNPINYLLLFLKKIFSFLFIDLNSLEKNYYHPLHYLPVVFLSITSIIGILISNKKSYHFNYLIFLFFLNILIFSSFFILARYKLIILPYQIIFTNIILDYLIRKKFLN